MIKLTLKDIEQLAFNKRIEISEKIKPIESGHPLIYPIPRGGVPAALALQLPLVDTPEEADLFFDDIIDSGKTKARYEKKYQKPFFALVNKEDCSDWVQFPWEVGEDRKDTSALDIPTRLLQFIGEDIKRGGLIETPKRFIKAWSEMCSGYKQNVEDVMKTFEDGAENYDQIISVSNIPVYSLCEHHLIPFFGKCYIGYIPDKKIIGLSKFTRLVDIFAKRVQVQERLTSQIAETIEKYLKPKGVIVIIKARHLCMESRGIQKSGEVTTTSAVKGTFAKDYSAKQEFLNLM